MHKPSIPRKSIKIQAIATCYNRVDKTLACIQDLINQELPPSIEVSILLVDDGSCDGTAELVQKRFPSVEIIQGTGKLYWAGGMRRAWEHLEEKRVHFDMLLVFNDDISLVRNAIAIIYNDFCNIIERGQEHVVVTGIFADPESGSLTYGGWRRDSWWHPLRMKFAHPSSSADRLPERVDTLNMNFALIGKSVLDKHGFLAPYFVHHGADFEFGIRVSKKGAYLAASTQTVGFCLRNSALGTSRELGLSRWVRLRRLLSPKEEPVWQRFHYHRKFGGLLWPIIFVAPYVRALFFRGSS